MAPSKRRGKNGGTPSSKKRSAPASPPPESPPTSSPDLEIISSTSPTRKRLKQEQEPSQEQEIPSIPERKRPRRAAASKPKPEPEEEPEEELLEVKQEPTADSEASAVVITSGPSDNSTPQRRLLDFIIYSDGDSQPLEILHSLPLFVSALVLPLDGPLEKQRGFRCEGIGPLESWWISGYEEGSPIVWICTDVAQYVCVKPSPSYKKWFTPLLDKCSVCVAAYKLLSKPDGGDPEISLDELIAKLSRLLKARSQGKPFTREYLFSIGSTVIEQLTGLDESAEGNQQLFTGLPALESLAAAGFPSGPKHRDGVLRIPGASGSGSGSSAPPAGDDLMASDAEYARLLQEQEERRAVRGAGGRTRRRLQGGRPREYVKINEEEIFLDYPDFPMFYSPVDDELDEYGLMPDEETDPADLPRRVLHEWCLYNSDFRFMSLEMLPMIPDTEPDVEVFGSGVMTDDDGSFTGEGEEPETTPDGVRVFLSSVREWMVEFGASVISISLRTDAAWYRLARPSAEYRPVYRPVLRTATVARAVIGMLKEEARASRLSFQDVVRRIAGLEKDEPGFVSASVAEVERYVVVHGQIILQQFAEYPDEVIRKSSFAAGLVKMMRERSHTMLRVSRKKVMARKGRNMNPRAGYQPDVKKMKPMRATTTRLITQIWGDYYNGEGDESEEKAPEEPGDEGEKEQPQEEDDEDVEELENIAPSVLNSLRSNPEPRPRRKTKESSVSKWVGRSIGKSSSGKLLYSKASLRGEEFGPGETLGFSTEDNSREELFLIEFLYESGGKCMAHGRVLVHGEDTILGNASGKREVFLSTRCEELGLDDARGVVKVELRNRPWGHLHRRENASRDEEERVRALEREKQGLPVEFFCQALYDPLKGGFFRVPVDHLGLGTGVCSGCEVREEVRLRGEVCWLPEMNGVRFQGVEYRVGEFLYAEEQVSGSGASQSIKGGRNKGLRAFTVCQVVEFKGSQKGKASPQTQVGVRRFYRPEDVDANKAYKADVHEVYFSEKTTVVSLDSVKGKCNVVKHHDYVTALESGNSKHVFFCSCVYDPEKGTVKQLPANVRLGTLGSICSNKGKSQDTSSLAKAKGKGKVIEEQQQPEAPESNETRKLATLDIFAGCGGLSEGLHQSGITFTKWAIEYDHAAAEAFKANHPDAQMFIENCNVVLRCIMEKDGDLDDCCSTPEATEMASKMTKEQKDRLPKPGEVEFISGGPPCQGFSGMNRFNQRTWSKVQCDMILGFLSYAEYFRPRYFLLENVRNFVSFNKSQTFRLTLASLLRMGYQVRFGCLQAGNYGVSQSRTRAFIWAAAPDELLPEWPEPEHVFASSQLRIPLTSNTSYTAVDETTKEAPLRSITVRDTIGDLPPVLNGAEKPEVSYGMEPESWFQKHVRGNTTVLYDHICKQLNELNQIRCQRIPKRPGSDWRDLPAEKVKLSTGNWVDLIPWCLPNTAMRHNQWKGLYGRLDWEGNFPTSITDPQPMGKVGMCFHPEQDRIVTVRECARSQGFPDCYKFYGSVQNKHRQIGNAVPPPLAKALGVKLKEAIEANSK